MQGRQLLAVLNRCNMASCTRGRQEALPSAWRASRERERVCVRVMHEGERERNIDAEWCIRGNARQEGRACAEKWVNVVSQRGVMALLPGQHVELLATVSHARTPACDFSSIRVVILQVRPIRPIRGEG